MKRLGGILCALAVSLAGCASPDGKGPFDEALKDLRGDNMRMRSDYLKGGDEAATPARPRD
jgi:hypothetical protein